MTYALLDFVCGNDINGRMRTGIMQTMYVLSTRFPVHLFLHPCSFITSVLERNIQNHNLTRLQTLHITTEPRHDKTNKVAVHPAKTQISLGIRPV